MRAANKEATVDMVSGYYLGSEIAASYAGAVISIAPDEWTKAFAYLTASEVADILLQLAKPIPLERFRKNKRGPKKPPPKRTNATHAPHVSTKRLLDERFATSDLN
jgi:hypothetical protein